MIHHFADLLDRKDDYWAMVPNRERFAFALNGPVADKQGLQIATIGADTPFWEQIFECGDLQELTLHLPSKEQIAAISRLRQLKHLRITRVQVRKISTFWPSCRFCKSSFWNTSRDFATFRLCAS